MKIKTKKLPFDKAINKKAPCHTNPWRPSLLFRVLIRLLSVFDLMSAKFTYEKIGMEKLSKKEPCLIFMNHSSFIDLKIASKIFFPRPYQIVCTSDGFVGKNLLMKVIGCIPTTKFVADTQLIRDMQYSVEKLKTSILMYPEASYSFDGTPTPLPKKLGGLIKRLNVPLVTIITSGAFSRNPLYNELQIRKKVKVSATVRCLLTKEQIAALSVEEIDEILEKEFTFDGFKWQRENKIEINEKFRADGLNRILYKCPHCLKEGKMIARGEEIYCEECGKRYFLTALGELECKNGKTQFSHIPDWFEWERQCVKKEIEDGSYRIETDVNIGVLVDYKAIYMVGEGRLCHTTEGFKLTGCEGKLEYTQKPLSSYSLYADYYWYEIDDVICIGTKNCLYYCFPKDKSVSVAKARLATEELYKLLKNKTVVMK